MNKIKVSVIIPIYNVEKYISQCLDSVINQDLKEIEIICINDGSTDNSLKILEEYRNKDKRITIINKSNAGYGAACNAGLRLAQGEYISIVESDDFIDKKMLKDMYNLGVKNKTDIVKSAYYEYKDDENCTTKINWSSLYNMPETVFKINDCTQLLYFHPSIWSCIYKNSFLKKENIKFVEAEGAGWSDNPFQVQTLCLAKRIIYTNNAYYYYRLTNPQSSSNIVNISNPFDRSDEVHAFLDKNNINDKNLLAHLYKREMSYIDIVINGISENLYDLAAEKIKAMISRMNEYILKESKYVNEYEINLYKNCQTINDIKQLILSRKKQFSKAVVVNN